MPRVWGHDVLFIVKDTEHKQWIVNTASDPPQHLVTIPWVDAFRGYTKAGAPDYVAAIEVCLGCEDTALTPREERAARKALARERTEKDVQKETTASEEVRSVATTKEHSAKVVDIAQFRGRRRRD